jgi:hypothetical protein
MGKLIIGITMLVVVGTSAFAQVLQVPQEISTRFGSLSVNDDKILLFKGHPLDPPIKGNNSLDLGKLFRIGGTDVVLVRDNGGTACPFLYYFVSVSKSGAKATPSFGTCGELTKIKRIGKSISVTLRDYRGPFEPEAEWQKATKERHVLIFRAGEVTENGKRVK